LRALLEDDQSESGAEREFDSLAKDETMSKSDIMSRMSTRSNQMMQLGALDEFD